MAVLKAWTWMTWAVGIWCSERHMYADCNSLHESVMNAFLVALVTCMNLSTTLAPLRKLDWVASAVDGDPTAGAAVFWRAQYVPTVLFPGRFQCPCDRVSLLSQKIHLRTGNLSVVGGTSVPQRTGAPSVGLCCNQHVQLLRPDCVSDRRCSNLIWALRS